MLTATDPVLVTPKYLIYEGITIRKMPWFLWFAFNPKKRCTMVYNSQIYVSPKIFDFFRDRVQDYLSIALLQHEIVHLERKKQFSQLKRRWEYWSSAKFRLKEELLADEATMRYLKEQKLSFPIEKRAKKLSSALYLRFANKY